MFTQQQQAMKAAAKEMESKLAASIGGQPYIPSPCDEPNKCAAEPSLRERIRSQLHRAEVESRRANQLAELQYLLDKHPEVARMLELLEHVKKG